MNQGRKNCAERQYTACAVSRIESADLRPAADRLVGIWYDSPDRHKSLELAILRAGSPEAAFEYFLDKHLIVRNFARHAGCPEHLLCEWWSEGLELLKQSPIHAFLCCQYVFGTWHEGLVDAFRADPTLRTLYEHIKIQRMTKGERP